MPFVSLVLDHPDDELRTAEMLNAVKELDEASANLVIA
jgi:hypothetical protein